MGVVVLVRRLDSTRIQVCTPTHPQQRAKSRICGCLQRAGGMRRAFELLASMPEDFYAAGRVDAPPQRRSGL